MKCPHCGEALEAAADKCPKCGKPIDVANAGAYPKVTIAEGETKCPKCGEMAEAGATKCGKCGAPLKGEAEGATEPAEAPPEAAFLAAVQAIEATAEQLQATDPELAAQMAGVVAELKRMAQVLAGGEESPDEKAAQASVLGPILQAHNARFRAGAPLEVVNGIGGHARAALKAIQKLLKARDANLAALSKLGQAISGTPATPPAEPTENATEPPPAPEAEAQSSELEDKGEHWFFRLKPGAVEDLVVVAVEGQEGVQAVYGEAEDSEEPQLIGYLFAKSKWDAARIKSWVAQAPAAGTPPAEQPAAAALPADVANSTRAGDAHELEVACAADGALEMAASRERYEVRKMRDPKTGFEINVIEGWAGIVRPGWSKDQLYYYTENSTKGAAKLAEGRSVNLDHPESGKQPNPKTVHGVILRGTGHTHAAKEAKCSVCGCPSDGDGLEVARFRIYDQERVGELMAAKLGEGDHLMQFSFRGRIQSEPQRRQDGTTYELVNAIVLIRSVDQVYEGRIPGAEWLEHAASLPAADAAKAAPAAPTPKGGATMDPNLTTDPAIDLEARVAGALRSVENHVLVHGYRPETAARVQGWIRETHNSMAAEPAKLLAALTPAAIAAKAKELDIENTPAPSPASRTEIEAGADTRDQLARIIDAHIAIPLEAHTSAERARSWRPKGSTMELVNTLAQAAGVKVAVDQQRTHGFLVEVCNAYNKMTEAEAKRPKNGGVYLEDDEKREKVALDARAKDVSNSIRMTPNGGTDIVGVSEVENAIAFATLSHVTADRMKKRLRTQFKGYFESLGMNAPMDLVISAYDDENDTITVRSVNVAWPAEFSSIAELANYVPLAAPSSEEETKTPTLYGGIQEFSEQYAKADTLGAMQLYIERMAITLDSMAYRDCFTPWGTSTNLADGNAIFATGGDRVNLRSASYTTDDMIQLLLLGIGRVDKSTGAGSAAMPVAWEPIATVSTRENYVKIKANTLLNEHPGTSARDGNPLLAVEHWKGMRHYCQSTWYAQGYANRTVVFGNPKTGPTGRLIRYEGRDRAEAFFTDKRDGYPGLYSDVIVAKVRRGWGYMPESHRNVLCLQG